MESKAGFLQGRLSVFHSSFSSDHKTQSLQSVYHKVRVTEVLDDPLTEVKGEL